MSKRIGEKIRKYRQLAGFNQEYVAEEIGMSGGNFGKIERGEIDINTELLFKLAKIFKIHVSDFFEEKNQMLVSEKNQSYGYATKADVENLTEIVKKLALDMEKLKEVIRPVKTSKSRKSKH